jgi:hypothetical protein
MTLNRNGCLLRGWIGSIGEQKDARLASGRDTMHEFKIGQYVSYHRHKAEGRFVVIRLLPQPKGELRYIIRSEENPSREYTAEASELRRASGPQ